MSRKKRSTVHLRGNSIRYEVSKWLRHNKDTLFDVPYLCHELGLNPDSVTDRRKVYGCILYWRNKFTETYDQKKLLGELDGKTPEDAWEHMIYNFNQNDAYFFLSTKDKETHTDYFFQPLAFAELEEMDGKRLRKQWAGSPRVMSEMKLMGVNLVLPDGSRMPISDLLDAGKNMDRLLK